MLRVFEPKTLTLVSNTAQSVTWQAPEFYKYWGDVIVYGNVSVRFQVNNACTSSVFISLNYATRTENIPFQERKSLIAVTKNTSVELSKSTVPAIGQLKDEIKSITLTFICAVSGTVTVTLQMLDEDELGSDSGTQSIFGSDSDILAGVIKNIGFSNNLAAGGNDNNVVYTVPLGKKFIVQSSSVVLFPTPSYPALCVAAAAWFSGISIQFYSETDRVINQPIYSLPMTLTEGDVLSIAVINNSNNAVFYNMAVNGVELFA